MKRKLLFLIGMIMFIALVWIVTTVGLQSSLKKDEKHVVNVLSYDHTTNISTK